MQGLKPYRLKPQGELVLPLGLLSLADALHELIDAAGAATTAVVALEPCGEGFYVLAFAHLADGLQIAVAAALEGDVADLAVIGEIELNGFGADALGIVGLHRCLGFLWKV